MFEFFDLALFVFVFLKLFPEDNQLVFLFRFDVH